QLTWPELNFGIPFLTYGRLRPLHTNAVIFAFGGCGLFASAYYVVQRTCHVRLFSDKLAAFTFWGWQLVILLAAVSLPLGITSGKEYAELEWPIDILITLVWVAFAVVFFGTVGTRKVRHIYVANWFFGAFIIAVALLHLVNSAALPVGALKSYSAYAGVQDAMVQWWYGHNAVAFFLTTPYLGIMYYFMPKAANRPVYSYRLSIIHFWSLIFIYIWAVPHHLLYSTLPDWAQSLGVVFSVMLIAPSWGGMLNGLLTLRGAWDRVREDPVLKFMVVAVTAYGMSTLEGPLLSLKNVNAIAHFTDWVIAHVHIGGLGWNGFLIFGMAYWLVPRMWNTKLYSVQMANTHFWLGTLGIIIYALPMYVSGVVQSLMWKEFNPDGFLTYQNFLETTTKILPMYMMRAVGGSLYLVGVFFMVYNLMKTAASGKFVADEEAMVSPRVKVAHSDGSWHHALENKPVLFTALALVAILIGGVIELVPTFLIKSNVPTIASVKPYTPLEVHGRDIYIREGCVNCHSQLIRPFRSEVQRYDPKNGEYSKSGEFVYDHPFLWGSKRTGPDLHRIGGKYADSWHYRHMLTPREVSTGSIMPAYPWLYEQAIDMSLTAGKIKALRTVGVPYAEGYEAVANEELDAQAKKIVDGLKLEGYETQPEAEIVALIAYLQRLGIDIKGEKVAENQ
ncbi:MAG: cytochrome-c oxidase, cbb3-type subunit I, partial [Flammeovirgaceae bacterium]